MASIFGDRVYQRTLTRRDFMKLAALASAGAVAGCASNPVTGHSQLMFMSENDEIQIDRTSAPHQFSADYGSSQDRALVQYVAGVGMSLVRVTHRPHMPYNFQVVNATHINAYAFPGGSVAITRGILAELGSEDELAGLIGHELGHINARHTAARMAKTKVLGAVVSSLSLIASVAAQGFGGLADTVGQLGGNLFLASYSREDERQADALGMEYMVAAGYSPQGMIQLMDMLRSMGKSQPNALELMFSTHPMSEERYKTAEARARSQFVQSQSRPERRERYMDATASLRRLAPMFKLFRTGEMAMAAKKYAEAQQRYEEGLKFSSTDYAGLLLLAKVQIAQNDARGALRSTEKARQVSVTEAQSWHLHGVASMMNNAYSTALADFTTCERILPGNPTIIFMKGFACEGMQDITSAAQHYKRYLAYVSQGEMAQHASARLSAWGYR